MKLSDISEDMWELLFAVRVSVRYHDRRRNFFATWHRSTAAVGALFGSAAVAALVGKMDTNIGLLAAAAVTMMSVFDLICGFSESANRHNELRRRFVDLEQDIVANHDDSRLGELQRKRLDIEKDEPPARRALCALVQNEQVLADYPRDKAREHFIPVSWWRHLTAHLLAHADPA